MKKSSVISHYQKIIDQYDYISFDIFDTLILRNVAIPSDVFYLVENKEKQSLSTIPNFHDKRIEAEQLARKKKGFKEITLNDIYDILSNEFAKEICERYKLSEIEFEKLITCKKEPIYELYKYCLDAHKHIFIISDMYLPLEIITSILVNNQITGYEKIYLSSEMGMTKHTGTLYKHVLTENDIKASQILHIGDNKNSDILQARKKGIKTLYFPRTSYDINGELSERTLSAFCKNSNNTSFGYQYFGGLLYGYVNWLNKELNTCDYDKVLFFSREGYFIKQAYDLVKNVDAVEGIYFYASRRALQVPTFHIDVKYLDIMNSMFLPREFNVDWLIKHWGLNSQNYSQTLTKLGISLDYSCSKFDVLHDEKIIELYEHLKNDIIENSQKEYFAFLNYLEKNKVHGSIAMVDIGWFGNMQKAFETIIKKSGYPLNITGYYLGYNTGSNNYKIQDMNGYVHDPSKKSADFLIDLYVETAIELFFMAPHGTVQKYTSDGAKIGYSEYDGTETKKIINLIQNDALQFVKDFYLIGKYLENIPAQYTRKFFHVFKCPTINQAKFVGQLKVLDTRWIALAEPQSIFYYFVHPSTLKTDFLRSSWKIGLLKRLLKIPMPYFNILKGMRHAVMKIKGLH